MRVRLLTAIILALCLLAACGEAPSAEGVLPSGGAVTEGAEASETPSEATWQNPLSDKDFIIHACGQIGENSLTNSVEAFRNAVSDGQTLIEVDFRFSEDGHLVCAHDFPNGGIMSRDEFLSSKLKGGNTPMDLPKLIELMEESPSVYIITDIKDDNIDGARAIAEACPELRERFIVQIYHQDEYEKIEALGFSHIIYTIYNETWEIKSTPVDILRFAENHRLCCITYPAEMDQYVESFTSAMLMSGERLFVHTVNDPAEAAYWLSRGVGIYTDITDSEALIESGTLGV